MLIPVCDAGTGASTADTTAQHRDRAPQGRALSSTTGQLMCEGAKNSNRRVCSSSERMRTAMLVRPSTPTRSGLAPGARSSSDISTRPASSWYLAGAARALVRRDRRRPSGAPARRAAAQPLVCWPILASVQSARAS